MAAKGKCDGELLAFARERLSSAVIGDILDQMGLLRQFLPPYLHTLSTHTVIVGRAMTVMEADTAVGAEGPARSGALGKDFGVMFEALDSLREGDVYICAGSSPEYALWGGLMSRRARYLGAAGAVVDGFVRDTSEILSLEFPVICRGSFAQDQKPRGKVVDFGIPIRFGQSQVCPGDVIFGDTDGALVIPRGTESEVFRLAAEKLSGEKGVRAAIESGVSAVEAYKRFRIM